MAKPNGPWWKVSPKSFFAATSLTWDYLGTFSPAEQLPTLEGRRALLVEDDEVIARTWSGN